MYRLSFIWKGTGGDETNRFWLQLAESTAYLPDGPRMFSISLNVLMLVCLECARPAGCLAESPHDPSSRDEFSNVDRVRSAEVGASNISYGAVPVIVEGGHVEWDPSVRPSSWF